VKSTSVYCTRIFLIHNWKSLKLHS
jgi:hypothetical protein